MIEDKISITPFVIYVDSNKPTLRLCESGAKIRKNVIGGAIHAYVFKHGKRIRTPETKCSDNYACD